MNRWKRQFSLALVASMCMQGAALAIPSCGAGATAGDPCMQSATYSINESEIGGNGQNASQSGGGIGYKLLGVDDGGSSLGEAAVGNSASGTLQTTGGFNTSNSPTLSFIINTPTVALGVLSAATLSTGTATFTVQNYTSSGYVVQLVGVTPAYAGHNLTALATDTGYALGNEQFGVNLVANTGVGSSSAPVQVDTPKAGDFFSYGVAGNGITGVFGSTRPYTIIDKYRFVPNDTIASSPKSSGRTQYTMTMMAGASKLTPSGAYTGTMLLVCIGTF